MSLHVVILAAGQGKRMRSRLPKVLQPIAGTPMLERVVETANELSPDTIHIIIGHGGEEIKQKLAHLKVNWVIQEEQLGTGHALQQALPHTPCHAKILVLSGDVPLIQAETLSNLEKISAYSALGLLTATLDDPTGLGRILRNSSGAVEAIIEEKDASIEQKGIREIYSGICCAKASALNRWLPKLCSNNAQGEYYLTEIIALAVEEGHSIASIQATEIAEILGVNNQLQRQQLERLWQQKQAEKLMLSGVTIADASRIDIRGELICEQDVEIDINTLFEGRVEIQEGAKIGANCVLKNVVVGPGSVIHPNSFLEDCVIGASCQVGPFARLRTGTKLASNCKIGNFVETKKTVMAENSKASHLSYLGDASIGQDVNIGAGTITCNYDGVHKYQTIIEDGAFIGSDTQLIAPVTVGKNAIIGAGSSIRKDAPAGELTLSISKQKTIYGWERAKKREV